MKKWLVLEAALDDGGDSEYTQLDSVPMVELEPGEYVCRKIKCPECDGTGRCTTGISDDVCFKCNGDKEVMEVVHEADRKES